MNTVSAGGAIPVYVRGKIPEIRRLPQHAAQAHSGVAVSTWQSEGITRYAGIDRTNYFLLCGALGLLQYRALALNPLLQPDDFLHDSDNGCLFSTRPLKQEYALLLERPHICPGCVQFFDCLGCEPEVGALLDVLEFIRGAQWAGAREN
jgi:hypothetical protein